MSRNYKFHNPEGAPATARIPSRGGIYLLNLSNESQL
jgi:hypothetical protein